MRYLPDGKCECDFADSSVQILQETRKTCPYMETNAVSWPFPNLSRPGFEEWPDVLDCIQGQQQVATWDKDSAAFLYCDAHLGSNHHTDIENKIKDKIQVEYNRKWFYKEDYLDCIFPYNEQKNLLDCGELKKCETCDECLAFKQGKCTYGYSVKTHKDYKYTFNNKYL